ncbi:MAG: lactonase family protein [Candidatus Binataceae bacterium]
MTVAIAATAAVFSAAGCGPTNGFAPLTGEFAYVANAGDGTISVFSINTSTGALTLIQSVPAAPGFQVFGLALHWSNEFLYTTIDDANQVESFDIGDGSYSGQIFTHTGPFAAVNGPRAVTLNPKGTYLYATNYGGTPRVVSQYTVDQSSGALTSNGTAPTGERPFGIAVDPGGNCAYVVNVGDHSLSEYSMGGGGALTNFGTVPLGGTSEGQGPELIALQTNTGGEIRPLGQTIYVTDDGLGVVHQLPVVERLFGVSCGAGTPVDVDAHGLAFGIALHPKGTFLYTGNSSPSSISVFAIAATGGLTFKSQESSDLSGPLSLAIDVQGKFLYAANFDDSTVAEFSINQTTGALTPIKPGKIATENPPKANTGPVTIVTTGTPPTTIIKRL